MAVHVRLYAYQPERIQWARTIIPMVRNTDVLRPYLLRFLPPPTVDSVLSRSPGLTPFEAADGQPLSVVPAVAVSSQGAAFAEAFRSWVAPAALWPQTRASYDTGWQSVVTYAVAFDMVPLLWPTQPELLESILFYGIALAMQASTLLRVLTAVRARHSAADLQCPVSPARLHSWRRALRHGIARLPTHDYMPTTLAHLHAVLLAPVLTLLQLRDKLLFVIGMVAGPRPSELIRLDVCDVLFEFEGDPPGTAALRFYRRKNDLARRGHQARLGRAMDTMSGIPLPCRLR